MKIDDLKLLEMKAHEAFIRRAATLESPFMLKGSYVTRQYLKDPNDRIPGDLDWVYLNPIAEETTASQIFSDWVTAITELEINDGVRFRSFLLNRFWRKIDYAMSDDFPTVNTDLLCWVEGAEIEFSLDVSFNLEVAYTPIQLTYLPLRGDVFTIPLTVPISLQVSWKIHQTLVRPRFKDLYDLTHLVQHPAFDESAFKDALQALVNECHADNIGNEKLRQFLYYDIENLFPNHSMMETWDYWRHRIQKHWREQNISSFEIAAYITDENKLPINLSVFLGDFEKAMKKAGFTPIVLKNLPAPTSNQRRVQQVIETENFSMIRQIPNRKQSTENSSAALETTEQGQTYIPTPFYQLKRSKPKTQRFMDLIRQFFNW